jgi:DNA-binding GntR family transcriptional regulator
VSGRVADALRDEILHGRMAPGARIRQEEIAARLGVSRVPVREALRILEADGLVTLVANTGAWVAHLSLAEC